MNQICRVCGEPAAGFHFGAFTCEGCKSFFGRTYNNLNSISECKNNGECVINKKNRTSCKACRLRKCLVVGMSKSGSRYGRRSNWFKIHCLLQEQGGGGGGGGTGSSTPSPLTQKWMGGGGSGGMGGGSITPGDEDNNNVKKEPPLWRLPIPGMPLFGFPPPLPPFFLPRGLSLPPPPPPEPTPPPPPWQQQPSPVPPPSSSSVSPPLCFQAINAANINTNTTTTTTSSSSSPLDLLRSLGPVQDSPMDLRLRRGVGDMTMRTSSSSSQGGGSDRSSPGRDDIRGVGEDDMACGGSSDMSLRADHLSASDHASVQQQCERKVPLDLTCVKT